MVSTMDTISLLLAILFAYSAVILFVVRVVKSAGERSAQMEQYLVRQVVAQRDDRRARGSDLDPK